MDEREHTNKRNGHNWNPALVAIVSSIIGSGGGIALVFNTPIGHNIARPDPFTGSQAAVIIERVDRLEDHVQYHPDITNKFDRRITTLEVQNQQIIANQQRILSKLDDR